MDNRFYLSSCLDYMSSKMYQQSIDRPCQHLDERVDEEDEEPLVWCPAISFLIPDLASTRVSVIARSEATKQSPALALQPREIASLRSQ